MHIRDYSQSNNPQVDTEFTQLKLNYWQLKNSYPHSDITIYGKTKRKTTRMLWSGEVVSNLPFQAQSDDHYLQENCDSSFSTSQFLN